MLSTVRNLSHNLLLYVGVQSCLLAESFEGLFYGPILPVILSFHLSAILFFLPSQPALLRPSFHFVSDLGPVQLVRRKYLRLHNTISLQKYSGHILSASIKSEECVAILLNSLKYVRNQSQQFSCLGRQFSLVIYSSAIEKIEPKLSS